FDRVQHRAVMPASKLAPDLVERRSRELPSDVHGGLARKDVGAPIGTHCEFRVAHLARVEVLTHALPNQLDSCRNCQGIKDQARGLRALRRLSGWTCRCGVPDDGSQLDALDLVGTKLGIQELPPTSSSGNSPLIH